MRENVRRRGRTLERKRGETWTESREDKEGEEEGSDRREETFGSKLVKMKKTLKLENRAF